jgi:hypothetical protein
MGQPFAERAKTEQQQRLCHQRQREQAVQAPAAREVDQDRAAGRAGDEGQQRPEAGQVVTELPERQVVGHGRDDARHVRGVLVHGQEAARVGGAGDKGQHQAELVVGLRAAPASGQFSGVLDRHLCAACCSWQGPMFWYVNKMPDRP